MQYGYSFVLYKRSKMATIKKIYRMFISLVMLGIVCGFNMYSAYKGDRMSVMKKDFNNDLDLKINMYEKDNAIIADVNVAGIDPQEVRVEIEDGQLHIFGERRAKEEEKEKNYYYKESDYGRFDRLISLPKDIDATGMTYEIKEGMLKVIIPKK